ncbi:DUF6161 domain-containing protein [Pseudomonas putida]|uniref:DUF6161 domain-containing protein n=1 Tax=Pseudomonas putida TaxID=303 RepID=UPI0039059166
MAATLTINQEHVKHFKDEVEAINYVNKELDAWEWIKFPDSNMRLAQAGTTAFRTFVSAEVDPVPRGGIPGGNFKLGTHDKPFLLSDSPEGKLILSVRENVGVTVAFYMFLLFNLGRRNLVFADNALAGACGDPLFEFEKNTAIGIINQYFGINSIVSAYTGESAASKLMELDAYIDAARDNVSQAISGVVKNFDSIRSTNKNEIRRIRKGLVRRKRVWGKFVRRAVVEAQESVAKAEAHISSAKDAYSAQIDLKASVQYWEDRKSRHKTARLWSLGAVISTMCLTLLLMSLYFSIDVPLISTADAVKSAVDVAKPNAAASTTNSITTQSIADLISHFLGAALLLTFLSIVVRIALRQYNIHSSCALEAEERVTFTRTYLALMHEGKLDSEADRRLVLESLFRPNSFSASEISFTPPLEALYKIMDKSKQ